MLLLVHAAVDVSLLLKCCVGRQANEEGEESQSKKALEESKQQIAKLQKGLWGHVTALPAIVCSTVLTLAAQTPLVCGHIIGTDSTQIPKQTSHRQLHHFSRHSAGQYKWYKDHLRLKLNQCAVSPYLGMLAGDWADRWSMCKSAVQHFDVRCIHESLGQKVTYTNIIRHLPSAYNAKFATGSVTASPTETCHIDPYLPLATMSSCGLVLEYMCTLSGIKVPLYFLPVILQNANWFSKFFHHRSKGVNKYPTIIHTRCYTTL